MKLNKNLTRFRLFCKLLLLLVCVCTYSCHQDDLPKEYVGFKLSKQTVKCSKKSTEKELELELIAGDKSSKDRTVELRIPSAPLGTLPVAALTEKKVTLKAGKKSVTTRIKLYPSRMEMKQQRVTITCIPQWKEAHITKLTLLLEETK